MRSGIRSAICIGVLTGAMRVTAADLPAADELTESAAAKWGADADGGSAAVYNETGRKVVGSSSLRFETNGGFDTWLWALKAKDAAWDFAAAGLPGLRFRVYAENHNPGFQSGSPWIRFCTSASDYVEFYPAYDILNDARDQWIELKIPLNGDDFWSRTETGSPDLTEINYIEIHADTWDAGFKLWFDGLAFDVPLSPPGKVIARAGNGEVKLAWGRFVDLGGLFDHYAIYRETSWFDSVEGRTPIAEIADLDQTTYTDDTVANGTAYYYAVTAVMTNGAETTDVNAVGPRTPRDATDLQVTTIARTPRYPRYAPNYTYYEITEPDGFGPYGFSAATGLGGGQDENTKRKYEFGELVTFTATVRNRGTNTFSGKLHGYWVFGEIDWSSSPETVTLAPGETWISEFGKYWDDEDAAVHFEVVIDEGRDDRAANNTFDMTAKSVAFLTYVDESYVENFRENSVNYPDGATDDIIDWCNRHMVRFNEIFAGAGTPKRVHFDVLTVLADDASDPSDPPTIEFAVFPFRFRATDGDIRGSGYYNRDDDIDYGLLHEMGHQLGLIDVYRLDVSPESNQVNGAPYLASACLMHGCSPFLSVSSADAMTQWYDKSHGYFGQYLYSLPAEMRLRALDRAGAPIAGAAISVYQKIEKPGVGEVISDQVKFSGTTDADGVFVLPNVEIDPDIVPPAFNGDELHDNPFGYVAVVGTNGVFLISAELDGFVDYAWLDILEANAAFHRGETDTATFDKAFSLGGAIQYYPPADMAESNVGNWLGYASDGEITLYDDADRVRVGAASIRVEATGGFDNLVRYPDGIRAKWDLTDVKRIKVSCYAVNPNDPDFQNGSPWIRLGNADGYFEWHPTYDILNNAIGKWVDFEIPIAGNGTWKRTKVGTPVFEEIHYFELHADTWGAGFTLWLDGVGFDPSPQPARGDINCDRAVDFEDIDPFVTALISREDYERDYPYCRFDAADINQDGAVDFDDIDGFVECLINGGCL